MGRRQMASGPGERIVEDLYVRTTPEQEICIEVLNKQTRITSAPYYSTIHFEAAAVDTGEGGPYTYTLPQNTEYRAFAYAIRTLGTPAGFPAAFGNMTFAETNLQKKSETNAGQSVVIYGIAAMPEPGGIYRTSQDEENRAIGKRFGDARLLAQLATNASVSLHLNGDEQILRLGKLGAVPGHGGICGDGFDSLATQAIAGDRRPFGFMQNGWPMVTNFMRVPEGFVWKNTGNPDSMLELVVKTEREIVLYSGGDELNAAADETGAAGVRGYLYPDVVQLNITFYLLGWVMARRSNLL